ncbi:type 4 pilus major pilin [Rhizobacter sp. Root1221]|uniref:type 4 pilus major pilin n=1 Tax=Rhizobacter sp. Root1221 TaxID=1736433 RepID=UPI0006F5F1B5|nr:type 4 pilus major pilin [Rhizobacter sp. Root1221]KQW03125.1 hypothetical protein ASC87_01990 [Rhizobacter sp. Root1221]
MNRTVRSNPLHRSRIAGNAVLFTLLSMVIGGIVVAVGVSQYQDADRAASVQSTVAEVNAIIGNTKQNFGQYSYAGMSTGIAVGSRVIPESLQTSETAARNKFGGTIELRERLPAGSGTAELVYPNVPRAICTSLINGTQGLAREILIGSSVVKAQNAQVNLAALNAGCSTAEAAEITWIIGRT